MARKSLIRIKKVTLRIRALILIIVSNRKTCHTGYSNLIQILLQDIS